MAVNDSFWTCLDTLTKAQKIQYQQTLSEEAMNFQVEDDNASKSRITLKIEELTLDIIKSLGSGEAPIARVPSVSSREGGLGRGESIVSFGAKTSCRKFQQLLDVLSRSYYLISSNTYATSRNIYYENVPLHESQAAVNRSVHQLTLLLGVPRDALHVTHTAKGVVAGNLHFTTIDGNIVDVSAVAGNQGLLVPHHVTGIRNISSCARYILIVEKDATFQKIMDAHFLRACGPAILITGKGYPDLCTRGFVNLLWKTLQIPVLMLTDADPHGLHIALVYKFGSTAHGASDLTVPGLCWLGILPTDLSGLQLPNRHLLPLLPTDHGKLATLAALPKVNASSELVNQIKAMHQLGYKAEIQHLSHISADFLTSVYLPTKLRHGGWIQ